MTNRNIIIKPRCEADRKRCKAYVRIYKQHMPENKLIIEKDFIQHSSGFYAHLVDEVEANVSECYQGDYRLSFVSEKAPLKFDSWYSSYTPYVQHYEGFVIVLRFEAPYNFESVCI